MPEWMIILFRALVSFLAVFFFTRLIGKRQLSQITFFEYTVGIAIGDMASMVADNDGPLFHGLIPMFVYTIFPILISLLAMKSKVARNVVEGKARVLIKNGKVLEDNMKKERMSTDELLEQLRAKNIFKVADVEFAVMETNGQVNALLKSENLPLTPKTTNQTVTPAVEPQAVLMDGDVIDEALATIGKNRGWLTAELEKQSVTQDNVFLGQVDTNGELYLDLFDDQIQVPQPQNLKLTFSTLKKVQADLELYALSTKDERAKNYYAQYATTLQTLLYELKPYLTI